MQVRAEVLDVGLPSGPVVREGIDGQAALFNDKAGASSSAVIFRGQGGSDDGLIICVGRQRDGEAMRCLASVDASRSFPCAGEPGVDLTAWAQVTVNLGHPTRKAVWFGERGPQVIDVGVVGHFHAIAAVRVGRFGLRVERDLRWREMPLVDVRRLAEWGQAP